MFNRLDQYLLRAHQGVVNLTGLKPFKLREHCLWAIAVFVLVSLALRWTHAPVWATITFLIDGGILAIATRVHLLVGDRSLPPMPLDFMRAVLYVMAIFDAVMGRPAAGAVIAAAGSFYYFLDCAPPPPRKRTAGRMAPSGA